MYNICTVLQRRFPFLLFNEFQNLTFSESRQRLAGAVKQYVSAGSLVAFSGSIRLARLRTTPALKQTALHYSVTAAACLAGDGVETLMLLRQEIGRCHLGAKEAGNGVTSRHVTGSFF